MSSNYLWKLYFENDAEAFRRLLLEGILPPIQRASHQTATEEEPGLERRTSHEDIGGKAIVGMPTKPSKLQRQKETRFVFNRQALRDYDARGRSLIHLAATEHDGIPFLQALLRHSQTDLTHPDLENGWNALHRALYHGNITAARLLLDTEAAKIASGGVSGGATLVKTKDHSGESPFELFYASIEGCEVALNQNWNNAQPHRDRIDIHSFDQYEYDSSSIDDLDEYAEKWLYFTDDEDSHVLRKSLSIAWKRDKLMKSVAGDEVFAFGSNKNLTLGFGDEDDRQFPERVPLRRPRQLLVELNKKAFYHNLSAVEACKPLRIQDIQLSKLHSAIITSDPENNLYICGFGHGGRLGLGDDQLTQFKYKHVSIGNSSCSVSKAALGLDHTVVVLVNGEVWTWGLNKHGQLGYAAGKIASPGGVGTGNGGSGQAKNKKCGQGASGLEEAELIQSTPRRVVDNIRGDYIIGCAASRIHTVLHSFFGLYVFGKNEGQLGILEASDLSTPAWVPKKVVARFLAEHGIISVAATDKSTAVMLETHDVWLFANHVYTRVVFPVQRFFSNPNKKFSGAKKRGNELNYVTKITTGGEILCGLTSMGDVYTVNIGESLKSSGNNTWVGKLSLPAAQRVWSRKKGPMAAMDADVDQDGSIIICTESGSVWRGDKRTKANDPFSGPSGSTGGGGSSSMSTPLCTERKSKDYKFSRVPGLTRITSIRSNKFGAYGAIRKDCTIMQTHLGLPMPVPDDLLATVLPSWHGLHPIFNTKNWFKYGIEFQDMINLKKFRKLLESVDTGTCDMTIRAVKSDIDVPVHKAIVFARCEILPKMHTEIGKVGIMEWGFGMFRLAIDDHGLRFDINEDFAAVMLLIMDIYALSGSSFLSTQNLGNRVLLLGNALQVNGDYGKSYLRDSYKLDQDLTKALKNPIYMAHGDLIIQLAGGDQIRVYSTLLRVKSPFFETLFKGYANGRWIASRVERMKAIGETAIRVDMTHISREIFQIVLEYIYAGEDCFLRLKGCPDVDTFLNILLDVLAVADELMIDRLSIICQRIIGSYVNTRNASQLLKAIAPCSQKAFKDLCLQYICFNLETMLENHLLDDLDDWIMEELDDAARKMQRERSVYSRCQIQEARLLEKYPDMIEGKLRERQALIATYAEMIEAGHKREDALQASAHKQKATLGGSVTSTTPKKQRKKPTKEGASSNVNLGAQPSKPDVKGEGMFEMEDEGGTLSLSTQEKQQDSFQSTLGRKASAAPPNPASPASSLPHGNGGAVSWLEARSSVPSSLVADVFGTQFFPRSGLTPSTLNPDTPTKPWGDASTSVAKLDMKEIMAQAAVVSSSQPNLSLELSSAKGKGAGVGSTPAGAAVIPSPKLSQKEKRRLQQEQKQQQQVLPNTPEKSKSSSWATPSQGPRVALREVLGGDAHKPPPTPPPTALAALESSVVVSSPVKKRPLQSAPATLPQFPLASPKLASPKTTRIPKTDPTISIPQRPGPLTASTSTPNPSSSSTCPPFPTLPISSSHQRPRTQAPPSTRPSFVNPTSQSQTSPPPISSIQAFPSLQSASSSSARVGPSLNLSLADIIEQQEAEQAFLKGKVEKRSLEDIQQEQEFLDWWEKESERIRTDSDGVNFGAEATERGGGAGGRGGKGGGKGGKGRGGNIDGSSGNDEGNKRKRGDNSGGGGGVGEGSRGGRGGRSDGGRWGSERGRGRGKEPEPPKPRLVQGIVIR